MANRRLEVLMNSFETLNLPAELVKTLQGINITIPTPIQERSIPFVLEGRDLLASAQTGTGKTLAYALPLITKLLQDPTAAALVLVPTRELAVQVKTTLAQILAKLSTIKIAVLIGGEPMMKQFMQLKAQPRIIVGTPGRINDHLNRKSLKVDKTNFIVIDEADRMLDMGFGIQLDQIITYLPANRQTVMFSATLLPGVIKVSQKYLKNPESIRENPNSAVVPKINQQIIHTSSADKFGYLLKELNHREGSVIVFVKTKRGADHLADKLRQEDQSADAIHGDLRQRQRDKVIRDIRQHKSRILVATDIAARGLDIPHIRHVINYDLPHSPEDYVHRIGRTARAGQEGDALCLIAPEDNKYWRAIHNLINPGEKLALAPANRSDKNSRGFENTWKSGGKPFKPGQKPVSKFASSNRRKGPTEKRSKGPSFAKAKG